MDNFIKSLLGFPPETNDKLVSSEWKKRTKSICKPCWELIYCPYGPLVEQFPLPPISRAEMVVHNEMLLNQLAKGIKDKERRSRVEEMVASFDPTQYPEDCDSAGNQKSCSVFGHYCPVFFVNEPLTETQELRRIGRNIPRHIMMRVVRRDNNQCQSCGKVLRDDEIEFDHIIPVSKGGSSEEHNIRVACFDCNRTKSSSYDPTKKAARTRKARGKKEMWRNTFCQQRNGRNARFDASVSRHSAASSRRSGHCASCAHVSGNKFERMKLIVFGRKSNAPPARTGMAADHGFERASRSRRGTWHVCARSITSSRGGNR